MITTRLRAALLGSGAAIALVAATAPGMANEMDEMRAQIQALQAKINSIEVKQSTAQQRRVMPAAGTPVVSGVHKGYIIPGTKTSMRIGGYVKADFIYDLNGSPLLLPSLAFKPLIAARGSARANQQNKVKFQSRQTRFNIKTWTPTDWGELATHIEMDFFSISTGNETITNAHQPRLRHAYGRLGPVLAGQTWTTFMDLWAIPETVDFFTVASISFLRQTMLRYTHNLGGGTSLQVAIENPESRVSTGSTKAAAGGRSPIVASIAGGTGAPGGGFSTDTEHLPDFVLALTHVWKGVGRTPNRVKFSAVFRQLTVDTGGAAGLAAADSTFAYGLHIGVRYWVTRNDQLQLAVNGGQGIGRYILGGTLVGGAAGNGIGAGVNNFTLKAITSYSAHVVWKHHWTDTIRTNLNFSRVQIQVASAVNGGKVGPAGGGAGAAALTVAPGTTHYINSSHVNVIWSPVKQVNIGLEYQYAHRSMYHSRNGDFSRIQMGFQYKF